MENNKVIEIAAIGFVAIILVPAVLGVVGTGITIISSTLLRNNITRKIKKGLKDGSIVEINGEYYEVKANGDVKDAGIEVEQSAEEA